MFSFNEKLYTDVRIEKRYETLINYQNNILTEMREKQVDGAFVRVYDGARWYYSTTYDLDGVQKEIDRLYALAVPQLTADDPVVRRMEVNKDKFKRYNTCVKDIAVEEKDNLIKEFNAVAQSFDEMKDYTASYKDRYSEYYFYSSLGAELEFDYQNCGIRLSFTVCEGEKAFSEGYTKSSIEFYDLTGHAGEAIEYLKECIDFTQNAVSVSEGQYEVILSPIVAGTFAHESFGHKSEADLMASDESMKEEWKLGSKVAADIVSIVDYGGIEGIAHIPYDDEGTKAKKNYLIKDGILTGRLHCAVTADIFDEDVTGNARSMSIDFEPIVRMTNTYFEAGNTSVEELFEGVKKGYFIKYYKHGSGMSTFTIAPSLSYEIVDGKLGKPVRISVITGNVFDTLNKINGLSDKTEIFTKIFGGCGKMEQYPLTVGLGGPYLRVSAMKVL